MCMKCQFDTTGDKLKTKLIVYAHKLGIGA
jgi:hypothetical protein